MSIVTRPTTSANPAFLAAAWAALSKVSDKEGNRAALQAGTAHNVNLAILGEVDGERISMEFLADLTVGHDSVRASSNAPDTNHLVACILSKLNKATREKILRELPEEFASNGNALPAIGESLIDAAGDMLKRLRAKVSQPVKGSVACKYRLIDAN
jgi:hypothetical protein